MKHRHLLIALAFFGVIGLAACHEGDDSNPQIGFHQVSPKPKPTPTTQIPDDQDAANATPPPPKPTPAAESTSGPTSTPEPKKVDYPYGVPVQGKAGYVTSPYAPDSGYVDVHGFAPGQEVRDPYTQKIFLVP